MLTDRVLILTHALSLYLLTAVKTDNHSTVNHLLYSQWKTFDRTVIQQMTCAQVGYPAVNSTRNVELLSDRDSGTSG